MEIRILEKVSGAKEAEGLAVIIDVFRAFSLECYLSEMGVERIIPVGDIDKALSLAASISGSISIGERGSRPLEGFDYGNSPWLIKDADLKGKTIIHTTSSGTQGLVNAAGADRMITGALVNAKAIARYIKQKNPEIVSLVGMGNNSANRGSSEDRLCAEYIRALLLDEPFDIKAKALALKEDRDGARFFVPENQHFVPEQDFYMCIDNDRFNFVLEATPEGDGTIRINRVDV